MCRTLEEAIGRLLVERTGEVASETFRCRTKGCGGRKFRSVGFQLSRMRMGVAHICAKCGRFHWPKGVLVQARKKGVKVFLNNRTGMGELRGPDGHVVDRFWTTVAKPRKPRVIVLR